MRPSPRQLKGNERDGRGREDGASALILFGVVQRSLAHVIPSLREQVILPLSRLGRVDVFYHSWDLNRLINPRGGECRTTVEPGVVNCLLPEARGVFESQEEFDGAVDWVPLFERNPMRHCTSGEEAARATLMNYFRGRSSRLKERGASSVSQGGVREGMRVGRAGVELGNRLDEVVGEKPGTGAVRGFRVPAGARDRRSRGDGPAS